jgi:TolB-like protein/class 3 adenylate cyclase
MLLAREHRRLAAIVAIDAVGYSRLMGRDESGTHALLKAHLADRVMPSITRHGGRLIKSTGDGGLAEFGSTVEALSALIELQQEMANANREQPEPDRIVFRAGVHLGEVIVEDNDLYGDAVNIAARLQGEAPPGGILISRAVHEAARGRIKAEFNTLGELSLKNISRPIRAYRVEWKEADWPTETVAQPQSLRSPATPASAHAHADNPSIAVLAFRNLSGDAKREYFADGVVADLITTLSRLPHLVVVARASSYLYKGRSVDVRQVGSELGVRYVLDGSIQIAGGRLRISCELIDAASGRHLWADRYDGTMEDVFDLQDNITSSITATIAPKVLKAEITRAQAKPTDSLSAYDLYLRALAEIGPDPTESSLNHAVELLQRAIAADPRFASAYGSLANAYWARLIYGWGSIDEVLRQGFERQGFEAAKLAVELGKDNPVALSSGGFGIAYLGGRPEEGLAHIERALAINPNSFSTLRFAGFVCWMIGKHEESIRYYERAMQLGPQDHLAWESYLGISLPCFFLERFDQAFHWADRALQMNPRFGQTLLIKIAAWAMTGTRPSELRDTVQRLRSARPDISITTIMPGLPVYQSADRELFKTALRKGGLPE